MLNVDRSISARLRRRAHANPSAHLMLEAAVIIERQQAEINRLLRQNSALEKIAGEEKVYRGHGDYDILPALSAEEAQTAARYALMDMPACVSTGRQ